MRVGIVGAGMMGKLHAEAVRRIPGCTVVALADSNTQLAEATCRELGIPKFYDDYIEMLENEDLDAVHNCTPNNMHFEINKAVIQRVINVYCEKPLAMDSQETSELVKLAKENGVHAAVNFNYRQNAVVRQMKEKINAKCDNPFDEWERTFLIHGYYLQDWMMYENDYNWRCIPEIGGKSRTVFDIGSHWFDTVQFITGTKVKRVLAKFNTVMPKRKKYTSQGATFTGQTGDDFEWVDIDSEDLAFILFEMSDGVFGNLIVSQVSAGHKNDLKISIDGSHYSMTWFQEDPDKLLVGHRKKGTIMTYAGAEFMTGDAVRYASYPSGHPVGWGDALRNGIREFYSAISGGENINYATFADGDNIVKIGEACIKSNLNNEWVEVEE